MSAGSPLSVPLNTDELRARMEHSIDRLADLARTRIDPEQFFKEILQSSINPGGASHALIWRRSNEGRWHLAGETPSSQHRDVSFTDQRQQLLSQVSIEEQPQILVGPLDNVVLDTNGSETKRINFLCAIRHADLTFGILETVTEKHGESTLSADQLRFSVMLCEIAADFLSQCELQQLRQAQVVWQNWDQYLQRLWQSMDLLSVCATIANDGRLVSECDRISVVIPQGSSYRLKAVTGVDRIEPRSSATRNIELAALLAIRRGGSIWCERSLANTQGLIDHSQAETLQRLFRDSGATGIGIVPITNVNEGNDSLSPVGAIVFEQFKPINNFAIWQSLGETLSRRSSSALRAAIERNEIPWLSFWLRLKRLSRIVRRPWTIAGALVTAGIIGGLVAIPAEFTVGGTAELWPAERREVFAGSSGIVEEILVSHGNDVVQGQPLIVLRDPELETDTPRIDGEIATLNERLKGVQAARFTGGNRTEVGSRSRQLAADEEELRERLRTLERQKVLIEARNADLTVRSPIAGKVLTWDIAQHLTARPVERGQSLLVIGDTNGPWVVEVRVVDKDVGHILRARKELVPELTVDFMLISEPGKSYRGRIQEMSLSSEFDDVARSIVRIVVGFDQTQISQPRPGATVLPRIHCGRKPLGYVWLHDLIDTIRTRVLF